ncbi:hypothetical protein [Erythrobacter sp. MTPC3]|uniref:hypothetical protein n=1 Tax=Erythrobacter sp. MTPC3 TaxID=3056564 RepID=UPI0036F1C77F
MPKPTIMQRLRKLNRFYDPLVDAAFYLMIVLMLYSKGLQFLMPPEEIKALPTSGIYVTLFLITWPLLFLLVAARFMRDEFAQKIWSKTAGTFTYFVVFFPLFFMLTIAAFGTDAFLWFEAGGTLFDDRLDTPPPPDVTFEQAPREVTQFVMFYGLVETISQIAIWSPIIFFAIYKFYRWRDSR